MSRDPADKLVYMANQISLFFASQKGDTQALRVAEHLSAFWTPTMREKIIDHLDEGGEGLLPLSAEAIRVLQGARDPHTLDDRLHAAGEPAPGHDQGNDAG